MATETVAGSAAAKELGIALAQIYNYIRTGKVVNHKAGGWPSGKGIEVNLDEVRAAMPDPSKKKTRAPKGEGKVSRKARKADEEAMHEALEADDEEMTRRRALRNSGSEANSVRLRRYERGAFYVCPINPAHRSLYKMERGKNEKGPDKFHCPHQEHDGRGRNDPAGFSPPTKNVFTEDELNVPQPIGRLGQIMLEWIAAGREDLSDSLETWMTKNGLDVWIPVR